MEQILNFETIDIIIKLFVAMALGMVVGIERLYAQKTAGMRTYAMVSMGAALFIIVGAIASEHYFSITDLDPLRIAGQIVVGIGFIGAGLIFFKDEKIEGLTTASGLWVSAGIGMAVGFGLYYLAIIATLLVLFIFAILWKIEEKLKHTKKYIERKEEAEE